MALVFWLCLALLTWHLTLSWRPRFAGLFTTAGLLACAVMAASQPFIMRMVLTSPPNRQRAAAASGQVHAMAWRLADRRDALTAILAGVYDKDALQSIYPRPEQLPERIWKLRAARMAPFNEMWREWLGSDVRARSGVTLEACRGGIDSVTAIDLGGWRVGGWEEGVGGRSADRIVLVSDAGIVIGYGLPSAGTTLEQALMRSNPRWRGHASGSSGTVITAYELDSSGNFVCLVGSTKLNFASGL